MTVKTFTPDEATRFVYAMSIEEFTNEGVLGNPDYAIEFVKWDADYEAGLFMRTPHQEVREHCINTIEACNVIIKYLETLKGGTEV